MADRVDKIGKEIKTDADLEFKEIDHISENILWDLQSYCGATALDYGELPKGITVREAEVYPTDQWDKNGAYAIDILVDGVVAVQYGLNGKHSDNIACDEIVDKEAFRELLQRILDFVIDKRLKAQLTQSLIEQGSEK